MVIKQALLPFEGKNIKTLENQMPEHFELSYQSGYCVVGPSGIKHYLGNPNDPAKFSKEQFERSDTPYFNGAQDRVKKLKAILETPETLQAVVETYEGIASAFKNLKTLIKSVDDQAIGSYHNPAYSEVLNSLGLSERAVRTFSDIHYA